jgi:hypothetical protein
MALYTKPIKAVVYDGTNSAEILDMAADNEFTTYPYSWVMLSEDDGVLNLRLFLGDPEEGNFGDFVLTVGDAVVGDLSAGINTVVPADKFAAQWQLVT